MLDNKTKTLVIAIVGIAALLSSAGMAAAKFDDGPVAAAKPFSRHTMSAADLALLKLNIREVDPVQTASLTPVLPESFSRPSQAHDYNVFRSVVVPVGKLPAFGQWASVRPAAGVVEDLCTENFCRTDAGRRLADAADAARRMAPVEALKFINREVNRAIAYRSDKGDTWQTLAQSAARGTGDCEDFAIAKMEILSDIGFAPEQLQFIVLKDTRRGLYHAVLAVHVDGQRFILDNLSNTAASDAIFRTYQPIASFVGDKSFVHGFKGKTTAVASGKGGMAGIRLGSGG